MICPCSVKDIAFFIWRCQLWQVCSHDSLKSVFSIAYLPFILFYSYPVSKPVIAVYSLCPLYLFIYNYINIRQISVIFHIYFHSFRFAQGTKRYENVSLSLFFIYNSSCRELGILQITGRWVGCPACRMTAYLYVWFAFSSTNKCVVEHVILSLYKQSRLWLRRSVNAVSPYNL